MRSFAGIVFFFLLFPLYILSARDLDEITAAETAGREEREEKTEKTLLEKTLKIDIDTAGYFELVAWCKRAGLSEKGDKTALARRLYEYYKISPEEDLKKSAERGKEISIESARTTEYFTLEEVEEDYIVVKGDVLIRIVDRESGSEHRITAEEIYFNQTENILTARGDVVYTLLENGKEETFFGESLNFSLDTWEGVFFQGVSLSEQQVGEDTVTFRYYGDTIYRSDKDAIRLENGVISSSKPSEPYYRIEAKKIWVLAPGEWAILGASVYVGEVPLIYIPFFFKNRDKVVFRPAMGFRDKSGFYLQTTTYFIGQTDTEEDTLSFLQIGNVDDGNTKKVLKGIYLRSEGELTEEERQEKEFVEQTGIYGKLLFDAYSRLGVFAGLEINIDELEWLKKLFFFSGIARSRDIYTDPETGWYTPYWTSADGSVVSRWHSSYISGRELPFRYGLNFSLNLDHPVFGFSSNIETFSDPYFSRDFFDRSEETDWREFVGISEEAELGAEDAETESGEGGLETKRLSWYARGKLTPGTEALAPYITNIQISRADVELNWKSKEREISDENYPPAENRTEYSFPEKRFFYPDTMLLPSADGVLSGQLVNVRFPREKKTTEEEQEKEEFPGKGLIPPWKPENGRETGKEESTRRKEIRIPEIIGPVTLPKVAKPLIYRQSLSYSLQPSVSLDHRLHSSLWESQRDIDFSKEYSLFYTQNSFELTSQSDFFNSLATVKDSISLSGSIKDHFNRSATIEDEQWETYKLDDYKNNTFLALNTLNTSIKPLLAVELMEKTNISYNLQTVLFKKEFSETDENNNPVYTDSFASWDKEFIQQHSLSASLVIRLLKADQNVSLSYTLPPLLQVFSSKLSLETGPFSHYIAWSIAEEELEGDSEESEWKMRPLELQETFSLENHLSLQQRFLYSFEFSRWAESKSSMQLSFFEDKLQLKEVFTFGFQNDEELETGPPLFDHPFSSMTELRLWWFSSVFRAKNAFSYELDPESGWIQQEEQRFQPESLQFAFTYQPEIDPFWKNRIRLGIDLKSAWNISLLQYTNSSLSFSLNFSLNIHEFLKVSFGVQSENTEMYRYFQKPCEEVGIPKRSFLSDLFKSINIFSIEDRTDTPFNAKNVSLNVVHRLRDWDLNIDYSGSPVLDTDDEGIQTYKWDWSISFYVQWNPIPEIKKKVQGNDEEIIY